MHKVLIQKISAGTLLVVGTGVSHAAAGRSLRAERADEGDVKHVKHPLWAFLDLFTRPKCARIAVGVAAVLGVIGFAVSLHLKIGDLDPGAPELRPESRYNRDDAFMTSNYAASSDTYVVMVKTPQFHCAYYDTLLEVDALERELQQLSNTAFMDKVADGYGPVQRAVHKRLKRALDPNGILAPGKSGIRI